MNSDNQPKKSRNYVNDPDDEKMLAMLTLLEEQAVYEIKPSLSEKDKEKMLRREKNRKSGKSKTYSIAQSKKLIRRKSS